MTVHEINEIAPGVYSTILDFPDTNILGSLLSREHEYVFFWDFKYGNYSWRNYSLPIASDSCIPVKARYISFDFIIETTRFLELLPKIEGGMRIVQINKLPADYLDLSKINGKSRWKELNALDWYFECDLRPNKSKDYGSIVSPRKDVITKAISLVQGNQR